MAIYFIQAILIVIAGSICDVNKSARNKRMFLFFSFGLLILVSALRSRNVGTDLTIHYAKRYEYISAYSWDRIPEFSSMTTFEPGYCYFTKFLSMINPDLQFYVAVTSFIIYGVLGWFIYKNSTDVRMSTYLLIFTGTYYNYMNIIRQALAGSIILIGYEVLKSNHKRMLRYSVFTAFVLLAVSIHTVSILCMVFILFDLLKFKKREILTGLGAAVALFVLYKEIFSFLANRISSSREYIDYLTKENESVGHINIQSIWMFMVVFLAFLLGAYYMVILKKEKSVNYIDKSQYLIERQDNTLLFSGLAASVCRFMVFRMNIINRYSFYFMPFVLLLYPRAIQEIKNPYNKRIVRIIVYVVTVGYFLLMTFRYEADFHHTVPYEFFWQA